MVRIIEKYEDGEWIPIYRVTIPEGFITYFKRNLKSNYRVMIDTIENVELPTRNYAKSDVMVGSYFG